MVAVVASLADAPDSALHPAPRYKICRDDHLGEPSRNL